MNFYLEKYDKSIQGYNKILAVSLQSYGKEPHSDIATIYNNLGLIYKKIGK